MSEQEIWHCVFCGRHWSDGPPTVTISVGAGEKHDTHACPQCREYKGLEVCNPETCECWTLDVVRQFAEKETER